MAILELKNLSKGYGTEPVLKNIDLTVKDGEFLAILGCSGTGKTTLINMLAGLDKPDQGTAAFKGKTIDGPGPERGLVFQSYSLMPWLTVTGNVSLAVDAVHKKASKTERRDMVDRYIKMVGLAHATDRRPAELSGGMRQRVAVARALAMSPEVLLLDEPLSALDALTRANLQDEIEQIWEADRKTVVLITNNVGEAILLADRIVILNPDGTLGEQFEVNLQRPRERTAMNHNPIFKHLRGKVTQTLMDVGIAAKIEGTRILPKVTAICVTHDVDETILLADRVVMMTNGPHARIGKIMDVNLPRPRTRRALLDHPDYYHYREELLTFLEEYEHGAHKKKEAA